MPPGAAGCCCCFTCMRDLCCLALVSPPAECTSGESSRIAIATLRDLGPKLARRQGSVRDEIIMTRSRMGAPGVPRWRRPWTPLLRRQAAPGRQEPLRCHPADVYPLDAAAPALPQAAPRPDQCPCKVQQDIIEGHLSWFALLHVLIGSQVRHTATAWPRHSPQSTRPTCRRSVTTEPQICHASKQAA